MIQRVITALVALPIVLFLVFWGGVLGTAFVVSVAAAIGVKEFIALIPLEEGKLESYFAPAWGALIAASFLLTPVAAIALVVIGILLFLLTLAYTEGANQDSVPRTARVIAAWVYVGFCVGFAITIRGYGWEPILFLLAIAFVGDSGAYFVGSAIGKRKLAPHISPNKSVEGAVGGFFASVAAGFAISIFLDLPHAPLDSLWIAAAINIVAQVGDLAESFLKRGADIKDSGNILPGHGGILDRLDSLGPALVIYAYILSVMGV